MNQVVRSAATSLPVPPACSDKDLLTREQALQRLQVRVATLYTYVSRGLIRSVQQQGTRRRLFSAEDVERLRCRSDAHSGNAPRGESMLRWGEPVLRSAITQVTSAGPVYRGRDAVQLAQSNTRFENVAQLLWTGALGDRPLRWDVLPLPSPVNANANDLIRSVALALLSVSSVADPLETKRQVLTQTASALCGAAAGNGPPGDGRIGGMAEALAAAFGSKETGHLVADAINASLILCADFELAPAAFATRITASAGVELASSVLVGLITHSGANVAGNISDIQRLLFHDLSEWNIEEQLNIAQATGARRYGFNHPLFPTGDPRANTLLQMAASQAPQTPSWKVASHFLEQARIRCGLHPGMAIALVMLCNSLRLGPLAPFAIWMLGRAAGLVAHACEQGEQGFKIRPRASYSADVTCGVDGAGRA